MAKCQQTGRRVTVKVKDLSAEDGKLPELVEGRELLADVKGKSYPVKFVGYAGIILNLTLTN